jgi:hypothetical protein
MRLEMRLAGFSALLALSACNMTDATSPVGTHNSPSYDYTNGSYQLVTGTNWDNMEISSSRIIGPNGGQLTLGLHELVIPEGAVSKPTVFRMSKKMGPHILVDLEARDQKSGQEIDAFAQSVELRLSYKFVPLTGAELNRMAILWLKQGSETGELVPVPTHIDRKHKQLIGSLTHFSRYAMGMN